MSIDFSSRKKASEGVEKQLEDFDEDSIDLDGENILHELYIATVVLKDKFSWTKNLAITNKVEELQRFEEKWENNEVYRPSFNFSSFEYSEDACLQLLDKIIEECRKIDKITVNEYGFQEITVEDLRNLFRGNFEEFKSYVRISANLDDRKKWKKACLNAWPMNEDAVKKSKKRLKNLENTGKKEVKELQADDIKDMWENELSRLGVDYDIEIRDVDGCFNIPEEQTVVVARGDREERFYSREEAEMLTMHELFHVVRTYNGMKIAEESDFPPILGVHTPFYDAAEEGGAIYREFQTDVITSAKEKDYYLRALAAYYTYQDQKFHDIIEKLVYKGASPRRAYALAARNREILRHHIYIGGYFQDWEENSSRNRLLAAKVNRDWAKKIWKEIEHPEGVFEEPAVNAKKLFDYSFR